MPELIREYPVSAQWRRILMERLDAAGVIYRLASSIAVETGPIELRWYRAAPLDAALALPDGRTLGIVRQGLTSDRTGFSKRLWRLREGPLPGAVLMLMPDEVRLRHAPRALTGSHVSAVLALERDAAWAGPSEPVWRLPSVAPALDLRYLLSSYVERGGSVPREPEPMMATLPEDVVAGKSGEADARLAAASPAEARREAPPRSDLRLAGIAPDHLRQGCSSVSRGRSLRGHGRTCPRHRAGRSGRHRGPPGWPSPTGGWLSWPGGTAPPWARPGGGGASNPSIPAFRSHGATSQEGGPASYSGTSNTPPPSTLSCRRWRSRHAHWAGSWRSSPRPSGLPATSATPAGCAP